MLKNWKKHLRYVPDDAPFGIGTSNDARITYETADTDAKVLLFTMDESDDSGNNVPAFVFSEETNALNANLGLLDGVVEACVVVLNNAGDAYVSLDAGDVNGTENGLYFKPATDENVTVIKIGVTGTPSLIWHEVNDRWQLTGFSSFESESNFSAGMSIPTTNSIRVAGNTAGFYYMFTARDVDGAALVEVGRVVNANDPYFSLGGSQEFKFYNSGHLHILEKASAATNVATFGEFWVKNDAPNTPYFTDDAGTDKQLAVFDVDNGEMIVTSNQTATIETANTPHAFTGLVTGTVNDFSFVPGITGAITAYADYSGTVAGTVKATCNTHGLTTGDIITIRGTTNYNGVFQITTVDTNEFYFTDTWVADDGASDFEMGDYLLAGTGTAGEYDIEWNSSLSETGAAGSVILFTVYIGTTVQTKAGSGRKFANTDRGSVSGGGHITLAVADRIWFAHQSDGTNDLTVSLMNLRLMRLA